jgi:hypothetical protein
VEGEQVSFAEVVGESRMKVHKKVYRNVDEPQVTKELEGQVTEDGIKLDVTDLEAVGERLAEVRARLAADKKEEARLRKLVLTNPLAKEGYCNGFIEITGRDTLVTDDQEMLDYLENQDLLSGVQDTKISTKKLRKLAEEDEELAGLLVFDRGRTVKIR